ncbi:MAG: hypothetical protein LUC93_14665 [Planctomycetaceae bacterium]|nr:hypothetical protein [Planctomycetaceae bacterium]
MDWERERDALMLLGYVLYSAGRLERAEEVLAGVCAMTPGDDEAERLLTAVRCRLGRHAEVLMATSRQLALSLAEPEAAAMHWLRAEALWDLGRKEESADAASRFLAWRAAEPTGVA